MLSQLLCNFPRQFLFLGNITAEQNTGKVGNDGTSTVPQITGKRPTDTGTVGTGNVLPLPSTGTSTGKVPANTSTGSVPLNTTSTDNGTEAISIPTEAPEPIDTRRGTILVPTATTPQFKRQIEPVQAPPKRRTTPKGTDRPHVSQTAAAARGSGHLWPRTAVSARAT